MRSTIQFGTGDRTAGRLSWSYTVIIGGPQIMVGICFEHFARERHLRISLGIVHFYAEIFW